MSEEAPVYNEIAKNEPDSRFMGVGQMMLLIQDAKDKTVKLPIKRVKGFRIDGNIVVFDFFDGLKWRRRKIKLSRLLGGCAP